MIHLWIRTLNKSCFCCCCFYIFVWSFLWFISLFNYLSHHGLFLYFPDQILIRKDATRKKNQDFCMGWCRNKAQTRTNNFRIRFFFYGNISLTKQTKTKRRAYNFHWGSWCTYSQCPSLSLDNYAQLNRSIKNVMLCNVFSFWFCSCLIFKKIKSALPNLHLLKVNLV